MSNPRVARIMNMIGTVPEFMIAPMHESTQALPVWLLHHMAYHPRKFFELPYGKFVVQTLFYVAFVLMYSYAITFSGVTLSPAKLSGLEMATYFLIFSFSLSNITIAVSGDSGGGSNSLSWIEILIQVSFVGSSFMRFLINNPTPAQTVLFSVMVCANTMYLWIYLSTRYGLYRSFGSLSKMIPRLYRPILSWLTIVCIFLFAFSLLFYYILSNYSDQVTGFETFGNSIYSTFGGFVNNLSVTVLDGMDNNVLKGFLQILMCLYLGIATIILVNLLIAMLSEQYSSFSEEAAQQFFFERARTFYSLDQSSHDLPTSLPLLSYLLTIPVALILYWYRRHLNQDKTSHLDAVVLDPILGKQKSTQSASSTTDVGRINDDEEQELMDQVKRNMDDGLLKRLYQHHWQAILKEMKNFKCWICHYCNYLNDEPSIPLLMTFLYNKDLTNNKTSIGLINTSTRICINCHRIKRSITRFQQTRVEVAFVLFMALVWPLLLAVMWIPAVPYLCSSMMASISDMYTARKTVRDNPDDVKKSLYYQQIEASKWRCDRGVKKHWVENNLSRINPKGKEVVRKLDILVEATRHNPMNLKEQKNIALMRKKTTTRNVMNVAGNVHDDDEKKEPGKAAHHKPKPVLTIQTQGVASVYPELKDLGSEPDPDSAASPDGIFANIERQDDSPKSTNNRLEVVPE
eukprot:TRINITY_DN938_c1_g1_i1.p1 TRINITY_DN938_c1_g1~~TRINITY_DN938_c1_g1_i1.p1  ORF type:complete len:687 (+),score=152.62 TRINITY_DN938_c1_g1_i1:389-2449(+)